MRHQNTNFISFACGAWCLLATACSPGDKPNPGESGTVQNSAANCAGVGSNTPETSSSTSTSTSTSLLLTNEVTYEVNIRPLVSAKCLSCHNTTAPNLSNFDNLSAELYDMVSVAKGDLKVGSHSSVGLTQAEKDLFVSWQSTGFQRGTASTATSGNLGSGGVNSVGGCNVLQPSQAMNDDLRDLLDSEKARNCRTKNLVVNRNKDATGTDECYGATLDMTWCNAAGIKSKFDELIGAGDAAKREHDRLIGEGFTLDQCGVEGSKPIATFYKKVPAETRLDLRAIRPK